MKPSAEVEKEVSALAKKTLTSFEQQAQRLCPSQASWSSSYEKEAIRMSLVEQCDTHVDNLRVQGLYLPKTGMRHPVEISASVDRRVAVVTQMIGPARMI